MGSPVPYVGLIFTKLGTLFTSLGPPVISLGSLTCESYEVLRGSVEVIENPLREPKEVTRSQMRSVWS